MPSRIFMAVHVMPLKDATPRMWTVTRGRHPTRELARFPRQREAIAFGRTEAQRTKVDLVVHGRDGTIRRKDSFGPDSRRQRG